MAASEFIYGFHSIGALLQTRPKAIIKVVYASDRQDKRLETLLEQLQQAQVHTVATTRDKIEQFMPGVVHQGIVAEIKQLDAFGEDKLVHILQTVDKPFFLILDGITDPHNLGACMRSAEAAGVDAVIIPRDKSASLNATARKISSGASEVLPLIKVTNLARTLKLLRENNVWVIGTAGEATQNLYEYDLPLQTYGIAMIMGNEGTGMRRLTRENCDILVKLPMAGVVSSLNVSVAAGVCLFEVVRQRHLQQVAAVAHELGLNK